MTGQAFGNYMLESVTNFAPLSQLGMLAPGIFVIEAEFASASRSHTVCAESPQLYRHISTNVKKCT